MARERLTRGRATLSVIHGVLPRSGLWWCVSRNRHEPCRPSRFLSWDWSAQPLSVAGLSEGNAVPQPVMTRRPCVGRRAWIAGLTPAEAPFAAFFAIRKITTSLVGHTADDEKDASMLRALLWEVENTPI